MIITSSSPLFRISSRSSSSSSSRCSALRYRELIDGVDMLLSDKFSLSHKPRRGAKAAALDRRMNTVFLDNFRMKPPAFDFPLDRLSIARDAGRSADSESPLVAFVRNSNRISSRNRWAKGMFYFIAKTTFLLLLLVGINRRDCKLTCELNLELMGCTASNYGNPQNHNSIVLIAAIDFFLFPGMETKIRKSAVFDNQLVELF